MRVLPRRIGELLGGPADGAEIYLPDMVAMRRWYHPVIPPSVMCGRDLAGVRQTAVYELITDRAGIPIETSGGRLRYRYHGLLEL